MPPRKPGIALVSDHAPFRHLVAQRLVDQGLGPVLQLETRDSLAAALNSRTIDVVIVDDASEQSFARVRAMRAELPALHVILLATPLRDSPHESVVESDALDRATTVAALVPGLRNGMDERTPHRHWNRITARQRDVMRWLATGLDNAAIGQKLRIGERAVKAHVSSLLALFGLDNRTQLALLAHRAGLRPPRR